MTQSADRKKKADSCGPNKCKPQGWWKWVGEDNVSDQRRAKVPSCVDGLSWGFLLSLERGTIFETVSQAQSW